MQANGKDAIAHLHAIMDDEAASPRDRLNAAVSASRCERLELLPGEPAPASVQYLRALLDDPEVPTNHRREAAAAAAIFERRSRKAALTFAVPDTDEKRRAWVRLVNGGLRTFLSKRGRWPQDKRVLLTAAELDVSNLPDPELVFSALSRGVQNRHERRRQRAIDEPIAGVWSGTEEQRLELIRPLAQAVHERLKACKLG